jgi:putative SOS response-associated peptidase YedK
MAKKCAASCPPHPERLSFPIMCGRFTLTKDTKEITQRWQIRRIEVKARYNIAPTQNVLIVTDDGERELVQMRWGLIPSWEKIPFQNPKSDALSN